MKNFTTYLFVMFMAMFWIFRINIIRKKYNPLNKDCKIFEREGLDMKEKDIVLEEVIEQLNFIERIIFKKKFIKIYKLGIAFGFNNK